MKRSSKRLDASGFLLLAIAVLAAAGGFAVFRVIRSDPLEEALSKKDVINILFVFEEENGEKPLGSYVLMYSPDNNRAAAISVPGGVGMILSSIDQVGRIDSVYNPRNPAAFMTELESLLDLEIGYCVVFEEEKLGKIVDLIEGVELFIPQPIEIYENLPILFPSGNNNLDGDKARQYIGFEIPEEEQGQTQLRRERFFLGLLKSLGEKNAMLNNPHTGKAFYSLIKTKMNTVTRRRLFNALSSLDISRVTIQGVAGVYREVSGQELLFPSYNGTVIKDIVRQSQRSLSTESGGDLAERFFTVEILNGTTATGLATRTAELIRGFRYDVVATGNAENNEYDKTEIIDRTGLEEAVNVFAGIIKCKNIRHEERLSGEDAPPLRSSSYGADFTLIIGRDFNGRVVTGN